VEKVANEVVATENVHQYVTKHGFCCTLITARHNTECSMI